MSSFNRITATPEQIAAANAAMKPTVYRTPNPEYMDDYVMSPNEGRQTTQGKQRVDDFFITNPLGAPGAYDEGNWFTKFMDDTFPTLMVASVAAGAAIVGGSVLFGAGGAGAGAGAAGVEGAAGTVGAAAAPAAGTGLGTAAGTSLGTTIGASGIPQVIISGAAPAAGGSAIGAVGAGAAAAGLGGLISGGGSPSYTQPGEPTPNEPMQVVEIPRPTAPASSLGDAALPAGLGAIGAGSATGDIPWDSIEQMPDLGPPPSSVPALPPPVTAPVTSNPTSNIPWESTAVLPPLASSGGSTTPTAPTSGTPSLNDIFKGLAPWLSGINDYKNSKEDAEWWKSQIDSLQGMYKPGTLEAEQMRQKMEARDAASGRRSQYGVREVNLASNLAEKRGQIMTSAGYQNMANAYRNRDSQSLNSLFAAAGNSNNANNLSSLISGLGGLFKG